MLHISRYQLLVIPVVLFLLILAGIFYYQKTAPSCSDCNIVLISIDTLRADHLGTYGYKKKTSPNIDKFANNSLVFENYYSTAPWTLPSHASLFASDYPSNLHMQVLYDKLHANTPTIASVLAENGYVTQGFDQGFNFVSSGWGLTQGFQNYDMGKREDKDKDAKIVFPKAEKWMDDNKEKKFFLFLHTFQVHDPYCPDDNFDEFAENYQGEFNCIDIQTIDKQGSKEIDLPEEDLERMVSLYDGDILETDLYIGNLLRKIEQLGLDKKTIVIITSDHGEEFGERGNWGKHGISLTNEQIKVPLIINIPNKEGARNPKLMSSIDVAPSILDLVGLKPRSEFKGIPFTKLADDRPIFSELSSFTYNIKTHRDEPKSIAELYALFPTLRAQERDEVIPRTKLAVIYNGFKYVKNYENNWKAGLFDLVKDPGERTNLVDKNSILVKEMEKLMKDNMSQE